MDYIQRLEVLQSWYTEGKVVITPDCFGPIEHLPERGSGAWGYGGDSIAVYVNGRPYQSRQIIELN